MGAQGTGTDGPRNLVLDAGGLIAFERGDTAVTGLVEDALDWDVRVILPSTALAQAWRGGPRSALLAYLLAGGEVDVLDDARAKEVGVRLGARGRSDIADAHAVCCALAHQGDVVTSDPDDIGALFDPSERVRMIAI